MNQSRTISSPVDRLIISGTILFLASVLFIAFIFFYYRNGEHIMRVLPPCLFYTLTGYKCPSCGLQRAVFNMVHGNFVEAVKQNALVVFVTTYGTLFLFKSMFAYIVSGKFWFPQIKNSHIYMLLFLITIFTILRNVFGGI